jgi:hypothetical protein
VKKRGFSRLFKKPVARDGLEGTCSNIQVFDENSLLFDEFEPGFGVLAH